ncbi:MAG: alanine--tRNA ligase, partial [Lachnospiraceae bacterium]|nr:alanine--tRNA ligase [Lachnospiraceae bacterium]
MKQFTSNELRKAWVDFYKERGHVDVGAVSLVSDGSTGVMFNVAGMQPLMPYLLGEKHPMGTRLCNVQGCVRTNDIESVGDKSHVTFFEMLGSWSLGDYFKKERCQWSYELLTQVFGFDADHLAATVFAGDENAPRDEESAQYRIASGFRKDRIFYLPAEDNWWGLEYGPCGPDSEMFYVADVPDCGPDCGPGCHCGKYTELGNDVFMQYEKHHDGTLSPLAQKNVDTGWGLERILAFLNGTKDVYKTDVFAPVVAQIEKLSGAKYDADDEKTRSIRILADHLRTAVMLIGDDARLLPDNTGAGYILRRLIRRAVRHGRTLGISTNDMLALAAVYIDEIYRESYPRLAKNRAFILTELEREMQRFESTLENGIREFRKLLDAKKQEGEKTLDGKSAFYLYDTFGFPLELTVEMAQEEGIDVDEAGFAESMRQQKELARSNQNFSAKLNMSSSVFETLDEELTSKFIGYVTLRAEAKILAMADESGLADVLKEGTGGTVITGRTPFYATMGGQKGDIGVITTPSGTFTVEDTVKLPGGRIGHVGKVTKGEVRKDDIADLCVDEKTRARTCRNHSATHLLHSALREVLGDAVEQAGSYQDPDRTRFDFSYGQALTGEELERVETLVNEKIADNLEVDTDEMSLDEAKKSGAIALFSEKYGEKVRVVSMGDYSKELCGGTHVKTTGEIMNFKILSESGIAAGVRRIEAVTGDNVRAYYRTMENRMREAAKLLKATDDSLADHIRKLQEEVKALRSENESLKSKEAKDALSGILSGAEKIGDITLVTGALKGVEMNALRDLGDQIRAKEKDCVAVLFSENGGKVSLIATATDSAIAKGAHAGNLIKEVAPLVGGGG